MKKVIYYLLLTSFIAMMLPYYIVVYISKDYQFLAYSKKTNLHDFVLKVIAKFINTKLIKE